MSDIAYDTAKYLADNGFGTLGTDIHVGYMPDDDAAIAVILSGGLPHKYTPINDSVLDIYVKNTSASEAISTLSSIKNFIHRMHNTSLTNNFAYSFLVIGDIEDVARDPEYSKVFKLTVQLLHRDTTLIS